MKTSGNIVGGYMRQLKVGSVVILITVILVVSWCSCSGKKEETQRVRDLDFTIVQEADVPKELMTIINEKKANPFKLKFTSNGKDYLYIVVGYGEQRTGGYSIAVEDLFLSNNAIYIDTTLIGPKKDELVTTALTYPFIVVKTEYIDKNVVFR